MSLSLLTARDFSLRVGTRTVRRAEIEEDAARLAPSLAALGEPGSAIEVPAPDPATLLAWLEAAWQSARVPVPRARVAIPTLLDTLPTSDRGLVLRTSGSRGRPKFVAFDLAAVGRSAAAIAGYLELCAADRVAVLQPLEHGFGLIGQLFAAIGAGSEVVWANSPFVEEQVRAIEEHRATVIGAVPYSLGRLLDAGLGEGAIRVVGAAGGPLPLRLAARLVGHFRGAVVYNQYGCTEAGPRLTACPSTSSAFHGGSVGKPIAGVALRVLDDGEIGFLAQTSMRGYLGDPSATDAARIEGGWRTGDRGRIDADNNLYVEGRVDDLVKVRGLTVSLGAVVHAFEACGASAAVAVLTPSPDDGEPVVGALYESPREIAKKDLLKHLPLEARPSVMRRIAVVPRLPSGKVDFAAAAQLLRSPLHDDAR